MATTNVISHVNIDWSQLQAEAPVRKPLDPANPKGASWGSSSLRFGDNKYVRIDVGRLKSVKLVIPPKNENVGADGKIKPVEPALLIPLDEEYAHAFNFFTGLENRIFELAEENRVAYGFGSPEYRNNSMKTYTKRLVNYKIENDEFVMDKPPVAFLRIKPWTKFFKINGVALTEEEKNDLFKSIFVFSGIIKLTYVYMTKGKWSLQWNLDEATVLEMEPRTKKQTVTASLQDYITANPDAVGNVEKLEKLLEQAKLDREKERESLGKHITGGNTGGNANQNTGGQADGPVQPGAKAGHAGGHAGGISGIPTSSEVKGIAAMPPAPNLAGFLTQTPQQPYLGADPNQPQLGYFPGTGQSAVPSASPSQVFSVNQYGQPGYQPNYQHQAAATFQPGQAGPSQFPGTYMNQGPFAPTYGQQ